MSTKDHPDFGVYLYACPMPDPLQVKPFEWPPPVQSSQTINIPAESMSIKQCIAELKAQGMQGADALRLLAACKWREDVALAVWEEFRGKPDDAILFAKSLFP